jgi:hypothetical protein
MMNIKPTKARKQIFLQRKPLTSVEITATQNNSGWLADYVHIYPNRINKKNCFEAKRDLIVQAKQDAKNEEK